MDKRKVLINSGIVENLNPGQIYEIFEIIQRYADQEMIAFAEWIGKSGTVHVQDDIYMTPTFGRGGRRINTKQLLQKYKEQCSGK